jgi:hypothetical protein
MVMRYAPTLAKARAQDQSNNSFKQVAPQHPAASSSAPTNTDTKPTAPANPVAPPTDMLPLSVADLQRSGIAPSDAAKLGMFSVANARAEGPFPELRSEPALVIPYFNLDGSPLTFERDGVPFLFVRVRYLGKQPPNRGFNGPDTHGKYGQPARSGVHPYFPQCISWAEVAQNSKVPLFLVEGEKKAARLALEGFNAIGIGGCWNFRRQGGLQGIRELIPELEQILWNGRDVYLALDGDVATNSSIAAAEGQLALEFGLRRGANVFQIRFPAGCDGQRQGADDYIQTVGVASFEKLAVASPKMREADALVAELNREYAVICIGGKTFIMREEHDDILNRRRLSYFARRDFELTYANRLVAKPSDPGKQAPLAKVWLEHPHRREYLGGLTLAPLRDVPDGVFNLWRGFSIEATPGNWSLMRDHIRDNICGGDHECFEYFLNWMARLVQCPGEAGQVAIVLRGGRGVGKGVVASALGRLISDHFIHAFQADHVVGKFNGHLQDCVYLFGDEAFFAGNPAHEKILNGLITESTRLSEQKFQSAITVPNYVHLILSTNSEFAVPAATDERRYFVLDVPDHAHKQDTSYFGTMAEQMDAGGYAAMLYELQNRVISKFDVRRVPQTSALADQKRHTLHARGGTLAWLQDVLTAGAIKHLGDAANVTTWTAAGLLVSRNALFDAYEEWERRRAGRAHPDSRETFGRRLQASLGTAFAGDNLRVSRNVDAQRPRAYRLGPLEACREALRKSQNMPTLWSTDHD